jgi:hypothetical protein
MKDRFGERPPGQGISYGHKTRTGRFASARPPSAILRPSGRFPPQLHRPSSRHGTRVPEPNVYMVLRTIAGSEAAGYV